MTRSGFALHLEVKNPTSQRSCYNVGFTASQLYQTLTSISQPFVRSMHRCTKSRKIQPIRMAMHKSNSFSHRPDRRLQRQGAFRSRSPRPTSEASQPSRPTDASTLRTQLFRVAASKVPTDLTQLLILLLWTRRQSTTIETAIPPPTTPPSIINKQTMHPDQVDVVPNELLQHVDSR